MPPCSHSLAIHVDWYCGGGESEHNASNGVERPQGSPDHDPIVQNDLRRSSVSIRLASSYARERLTGEAEEDEALDDHGNHETFDADLTVGIHKIRSGRVRADLDRYKGQTPDHGYDNDVSLLGDELAEKEVSQCAKERVQSHDRKTELGFKDTPIAFGKESRDWVGGESTERTAKESANDWSHENVANLSGGETVGRNGEELGHEEVDDNIPKLGEGNDDNAPEDCGIEHCV